MKNFKFTIEKITDDGATVELFGKTDEKSDWQPIEAQTVVFHQTGVNEPNPDFLA